MKKKVISKKFDARSKGIGTQCLSPTSLYISSAEKTNNGDNSKGFSQGSIDRNFKLPESQFGKSKNSGPFL